jgi:hypothetical protein
METCTKDTRKGQCLCEVCMKQISVLSNANNPVFKGIKVGDKIKSTLDIDVFITGNVVDHFYKNLVVSVTDSNTKSFIGSEMYVSADKSEIISNIF